MADRSSVRDMRSPLLVIKERDVGFFSLFIQVVNTLLFLERRHPQVVPVVRFGEKQAYYTGEETWGQVFEPLVSLDESELEERLAEVDASFRANLDYMGAWDQMRMVYQLSKDLWWSGSYYPQWRSSPAWMRRLPVRRATDFWVRAKGLGDPLSTEWRRWWRRLRPVPLHVRHDLFPNLRDRRRASGVIERCIRLRPALRSRVDEFWSTRVRGYVVGAQFRGTDARVEATRSVPTYDAVLAAVDAHLEALPSEVRGEASVFIASDEAGFVEAACERFDRVAFFDGARQLAGDPRVSGEGPMGWGVPAVVARDAEAALIGVVLDYAALCRCDYLVHSFGSVSNAVLLSRPDLPHQLVGLDQGPPR